MIDHEEYIVSQLKEGNESAYRYLFDKYYVRLCRVAKLYTKDSYVSENLVGDLIFYLWENRESMHIHTSLSSYLFTSIRNRCLNYLQQSSVMYESRFPLASTDMFEDISIESDSPLGIIIEKELELKMNDSIEHLPVECRNVFKLSRYENLSYDEIAERMGISVNTVRYHIKNALSSLRANLKEYLILFF
ncbi:MAG: polymerase sigma 70 [Bacteroidetes bacterium]|jgi:RNA polymerase sigma-70 factor, ECF subfamily|nr:polymerase sigma 70 [Bacteroidota bacterium]